MKANKVSSLAVASMFLAFSASEVRAADAVPAPYLAVTGSVSLVGDVDFTNGRTGSGVKDTAEFDPGFGVQARGGYDFGDYRIDIELGYRRADVDSVENGANGSGDTNIYTAMLNGSYDFDMDSEVTPYLTAGAGVMFAEGNIAYDTSGSPNRTREDKNYFGVAPALQIGVGLSYEVDKDVDLIGGYTAMFALADESAVDETILIHDIQIGLKFDF